MYPELVELHIGSLVLVRLAILEALNRGNGTVLDRDVPDIELRLPVLVLRGGIGLSRWSLGAVDESDDVGELGVHLQHTANHIGKVAEDTKGLVPVLIAIAPGAPEDALAPGFLDTRRVGKNIAHTSAKDDLTGSVVLARSVDNGEGRGLVSTDRSN